MIWFLDAFSSPTWHAGDGNGSSSLSYNGQAGFKPYSTPNSQTQGGEEVSMVVGNVILISQVELLSKSLNTVLFVDKIDPLRLRA
jgi:hypothetical protein